MDRTLNRCCLAQARADMRRPHAVRAHHAPAFGWGVAPQVVMGGRPHDDGLPAWWKGPRDFGGWWWAVCAWFAVFEAEGGNPAPTGVVEVSDVELWLRRRNGAWTLLQAGPPDWATAYAPTGGPWHTVISAPRTPAAQCQPRDGYMIHGAKSRVMLPAIDGEPDASGVFATITHRLVGDPAARYVVQAGVDWWPSMSTRIADFAPFDYHPGACTGPFVPAVTGYAHSHVTAQR